MRARAWAVLAVALVVTAEGLGGGGAATKEREKFQGTWDVLYLMKDGKKEVPPKKAKGMTMTFTGHKFMMGGSEPEYEGTCTLHPDKSPKQIDTKVTYGKDKVIHTKGIYEFDGDTLKIEWTEDKAERPTKFSTKGGKGLRMIALKRQGR